MKVLNFIECFFNPLKMVKLKKLNVFISILIMLLCTFLLATPLSVRLNKSKFETFSEAFNFKVFENIDDDQNFVTVTDEEKEKYNIVTLNDLNQLRISASKYGLLVAEDSNVEYGKEYVLVSALKNYDEDGNFKNYTKYFIHIVFEEDEELKYDINESFNKLPKDNNVFNHFLVVFYNQCFTYKYDESGNIPLIDYYKNYEVNFIDLKDGLDISHPLMEMLYPVYKYNYQLRACLFVLAFPTLLSLIFSFALKGTGELKNWKEYFNIAAVSSVLVCIIACIFSLFTVRMANLAFKAYPIVFVVFYFVNIISINRHPVID